jgi:hypothetical protein
MSQLQITDLVLVNSEYDQVQDITEYDYRNIMGGGGITITITEYDENGKVTKVTKVEL